MKALFGLLFLAACLTSTRTEAQPEFQLPFPCGQKVRMQSFARDHAPAVDIFLVPNAATEGALLIAPADGKVTQSSLHANAGHMIQIDHGEGWFTTYIHLQSRAVPVGRKVKQGDIIGRVGHTGKTSNGVPHVHFEMAVDRNNDGYARWGEVNRERRPPIFNGVEYATKHDQKFTVVSQNCRNGVEANAAVRPGAQAPSSTKYWVDTFQNAPGFDKPDGRETGTLNAGTNYVFCKTSGPVKSVGEQHNRYWLLTDLDSGRQTKNQWVSAYYLKRWGNDDAKDNSGRVIPDCKY